MLEAKFNILPVMLLLMVLNSFLHHYPKTRLCFAFVSQRTRLNWCFTLHIELFLTVKEYTLPSMVKKKKKKSNVQFSPLPEQIQDFIFHFQEECRC